MASAKQRAAAKRNIKKAQAALRKKFGTANISKIRKLVKNKSSKVTKTIKRRRRSDRSRMAKKKASGRGKKKGFISGRTKTTLDKVFKGAGAASIITGVLGLFAPQVANNGLVRTMTGLAGDVSIEGAIGGALSNPNTIRQVGGALMTAIPGFGFGGNGNMMMMSSGQTGMA